MTPKTQKNISLTGKYLGLVFFTIIFMLPIYWVVISSFKTDKSIFAGLMPFSAKALWFDSHFYLGAYRDVLISRNFARPIFNSFFFISVHPFPYRLLYHFPRPAQSCNTKTTQSQWSHQIHPEPNQDSHSGHLNSGYQISFQICRLHYQVAPHQGNLF